MIVNYWPGRSLCVWSHLTSRTAVPEHFVVAFYVLWNTTSSEVERMCECLHCNSFALGGHDIQNCDSLAGRSVKKERKKKMRRKKNGKGLLLESPYRLLPACHVAIKTSYKHCDPPPLFPCQLPYLLSSPTLNCSSCDCKVTYDLWHLYKPYMLTLFCPEDIQHHWQNSPPHLLMWCHTTTYSSSSILCIPVWNN